jgi:hypothetical protein
MTSNDAFDADTAGLMFCATTDARSGETTRMSEGVGISPVIRTLDWHLADSKALMRRAPNSPGSELASPPMILGDDQIVLHLLVDRYHDGRSYLVGYVTQEQIASPKTATSGKAEQHTLANDLDDEDPKDRTMMRASNLVGGGHFCVELRLRRVTTGPLYVNAFKKYVMSPLERTDLGYTDEWITESGFHACIQISHYPKNVGLSLSRGVSRDGVDASNLIASKSNVGADVGGLLRNPLHSDVMVRFKDGAQVRAHKAILAARSPMLKTMLASGFHEKNAESIDVNVTESVGNVLLDYLYTGRNLQLADIKSWNQAIGVYEAAEYYELFELARHVVPVIARFLTIDNVFETFAIAQRHAAVCRQPQRSQETGVKDVKVDVSIAPSTSTPLDVHAKDAKDEVSIVSSSFVTSLDAPKKIESTPTAAAPAARPRWAPKTLSDNEASDDDKQERDHKKSERVVPDNKHVADKHVADKHVADKHVADKHVADKHVADKNSSGDLLISQVQKYFAEHMDAIMEYVLKKTVDSVSNATTVVGPADLARSTSEMMVMLAYLKTMHANKSASVTPTATETVAPKKKRLVLKPKYKRRDVDIEEEEDDLSSSPSSGTESECESDGEFDNDRRASTSCFSRFKMWIINQLLEKPTPRCTAVYERGERRNKTEPIIARRLRPRSPIRKRQNSQF